MKNALSSVVVGLCLGIILLFGITGTAQAGLLVVVSDVNATRNPHFADPGNRTFFDNVLGGGTNVLFSRALHAHSVDLDTYYEGSAGVTTTVSAAPVDSSLLSGVDLMVVAPAFATAQNYTATEIVAMSDYLNGGGSILLVGEADAAAVLDSYNDLLTGLGSSIAFGSPRVSSSVVTGITSHALTAGVGTFGYIAFSPLTGGTSLVTGPGGATFVAVEGIASSVSEPAGLALFGLGLAALGSIRRRRCV
jgi:hypothetical protein